MSVKLYLRDNTDGTVHEYGSNPHDCLELNEDGSLHYQNLQNCTGTRYPEEGYSFVTVSGKPPEDCEGERIVDIGGESTGVIATNANTGTASRNATAASAIQTSRTAMRLI